MRLLSECCAIAIAIAVGDNGLHQLVEETSTLFLVNPFANVAHFQNFCLIELHDLFTVLERNQFSMATGLTHT